MTWSSAPGRARRPSRIWLRATALAVVLSLVALLAVRAGRSPWLIALPAVGAIVVPVAVLRTKGGAMRWVHTVGTKVGTALARILFSILAVPLVLVPGLVTRGAGRATSTPAARWIDPGPHLGPASAPWSNDRPRRPPLWPAGVVLLVALAGATLLWSAPTRPGPAPTAENQPVLDAAGVEVVEHTVTTLAEPEVELREPVPAGLEEHRPAGPDPIAALDGQDWRWTPHYGEAMGVVLDYRVARYENPLRLPELRSRYVNVENGRRATWRPPCEGRCDLPVVWFYGGSTAFGVDQRDDHTIASELARIAHADGIDIEVHNRGIPWYAHWQEAERFSWDLTAEETPELVLFYDGYNDAANVDPDEFRWGDRYTPADSGSVVVWDLSKRSQGEPPAPPERARRHVTRPTRPSPHGQAMTILDRYEKARSISRAAAAAAGVPVRYLWQPTRYDRPVVEGEIHWSSEGEVRPRVLSQILADHLPDDVVNVKDALDGHPEPVYTDDVHHNEEASRIIARAIYDRIRPDLLALGR